MEEKRGQSALGIAAFIISLLGCGCLSFVGLILAIIDLAKNDQSKKHGLSIAAIVICVLWGLFILVFGLTGESDVSEQGTTEIASTQQSDVAMKERTTEEVVAEEITTEEITTEEMTTEEATTEEQQETEEEYKMSCAEYAFKNVLRNPADYVGKRVKITVRISTVHEEGLLNATKYYFAYSESDYGYYGDRYAIFDERYDSSLKLLSDDIITVYGEIAEPEYTSSLILSSEEVFSIKMKYVELIAE